jgi:hypothetical protein
MLYDLARVWTLNTQLHSTSSTISENGTSVKKIIVDLLRYFLFEEKVTKENFRNPRPTANGQAGGITLEVILPPACLNFGAGGYFKIIGIGVLAPKLNARFNRPRTCR